MFEFLIGLIVGAMVVGCALLSMIIRCKSEHRTMAAALEYTHSKMKSIEKSYAASQKQYLTTHQELEKTKVELERLRKEKLDAWDIPDGC